MAKEPTEKLIDTTGLARTVDPATVEPDQSELPLDLLRSMLRAWMAMAEDARSAEVWHQMADIFGEYFGRCLFHRKGRWTIAEPVDNGVNLERDGDRDEEEFDPMTIMNIELQQNIETLFALDAVIVSLLRPKAPGEDWGVEVQMDCRHVVRGHSADAVTATENAIKRVCAHQRSDRRQLDS